MKKIVLLLTVMSLTLGANAQLGNLINAAAKSAKKSIEKRVDKEVDTLTNNAVSSVKNAIFGKLGISQPHTAATSSDGSASRSTAVTPKDYMSQLPNFPTDDQIADYACIMSKDNPSPLKMMTNPVAAYLAKVAMMTSNAAGSVNTMTEERAAQVEANYKKQIEDFYGVSAEELEKMSEEEIQELTYKKMYSEGTLEVTQKNAEMIAPVQAMMDQYTAVSDKIDALFAKADEDCQGIWDSKYKTASQLCTYFKDAAAIYSNATRQAMELRRTEQMKMAEQMDKEIADYVVKNPTSNADQVSYTYLTMIAYLGDAARIATLYQPSIE
ncbi:MAG: hypothetical protein MJZ45_04120 [Bacteroidales bacterium]|nr:hypothetical protein [Bacteroidales bacterium]